MKKQQVLTEQMIRFAKESRQIAVFDDGKIAQDLITSLKRDFRKITELYQRISKIEILPGFSEWLLDNYYMLVELYQRIIHEVDEKWLAQLPRFQSGIYRDKVRLYGLLKEFFLASTPPFSMEELVEYLNLYQEEKKMKNIEIWAIGSVGQMVLFSMLKSICLKAEELIHMNEEAKKSRKISGKENFSFQYYFCQKLPESIRRKQKNYEMIQQKQQALEGFLEGLTAKVFTNLRQIQGLDFPELFEKLSYTEQLFLKDKTYQKMDFSSKNYYRYQLAVLAEKNHMPEEDVANHVMELSSQESEERKRHIGYYLLCEPLGSTNVKKKNRMLYTAGNITFILLFKVALFWILYALGFRELFLFCLIGVVSFIPVTDISINLTNYLFLKCVKATMIPKIELKREIPDSAKTSVVISSLILSPENIDSLTKKIEGYYLANRAEHIYFGILGDLKDAPSEHLPNDHENVNYLKAKIEELNRKYKDMPFFALTRSRTYSSTQGNYIGWERKRGAITEFARYLRGEKKHSFFYRFGNTEDILSSKYIVTLDSDTQPSIGSVKELIGAMIHPLNRAEIDREKHRVTKGYGIIQPKVNISLSSAYQSEFSKIFAGVGGFDPYVNANSDVYQDNFAEGIFTGKGILDVDVFVDLVDDVIPDNRVLSHDLLEGSIARTALAGDIEFVDGFPAKVSSYFARYHRWVRGDWQLLYFLKSRLTLRSKEKVKNPLSLLSRWKMIDNLRRSLVAPFVFIMLLCAAFLPFAWSIVLVILSLLTLGLSLCTAVCDNVLYRDFKFFYEKSYTRAIYGLKSVFLQFLCLLSFLPYHAYISIDAAIRTVFRLLFTGKHMLEWTTAEEAERNMKDDQFAYMKRMWFSIASGLFFILYHTNFPLFLIGVSFFLSPGIAYLISRPCKEKKEKLDTADNVFLRRCAFRIWNFFDDLVTDEENFLPPDNLQNSPPNGVAHRTSPTNIGLYLLSVLSARDFGYLTTDAMCEKIAGTLNTIDKLETCNGHLFNWYDTRTLEVLRPKYVSTVDSGNYIACLIALKEGLREYAETENFNFSNIQGLKDAILEEKAEYRELLDDVTDKAEMFQKLNLHQDEFINNRTIQKMLSMFREEKSFDIGDLLQRITRIIESTSFSFLYNDRKELFSIGYNAEEKKLTPSYYDLLASEARQTSYIAVAKGEVGKRHWRRLGRSMAQFDHHSGLVSWTGTMFEYLMPLLLQKDYRGSLLDETYQFVVDSQIEYAENKNVPWGISESGFYSFDIDLNYQYKAFGIPDNGLKRGLKEDTVISPYSTFLAMMVRPRRAVTNLKLLKEMGAFQKYGYIEALDFTETRVQGEKAFEVVDSYMAHHQGMSFLALNNVLNGDILKDRFMRDPSMYSAQELLEEKLATKVVITKEEKERIEPLRPIDRKSEECIRGYHYENCYPPRMHILSNGTLSYVTTETGLSYLKCRDIYVNRFRKNLYGNQYGAFIYIRDINENLSYSATYAPSKQIPETYKSVFYPEKAEYRRRNAELTTTLDITLSTENNALLQTVTLFNHSGREKEVEVTSYLELILSSIDQDLAHPAFNSLFIRTFEKEGVLFAVRRPRGEKEKNLYASHFAVTDFIPEGDISYETDRAKFMGRKHTTQDPHAVREPFSNTTGAVLDPIFSLRVPCKLAAKEQKCICFITIIEDSMARLERNLESYSSFDSVKRTFELAHSRGRQNVITKDTKEQETYLNLLGHLLYESPNKLNYKNQIAQNTLGVSALWKFGISGDLPILTGLILKEEDFAYAQQLIKCHEFLTVKGLKFDLLLLTKDDDSYMAPVFRQTKEILEKTTFSGLIDCPGGVFIRSLEAMTEADRNAVLAKSSFVVDPRAGTIVSQVQSAFLQLDNTIYKISEEKEQSAPYTERLRFYNGYGGFNDKNEYVILLADGRETPLPWCNVIANPRFGCVATESGGGYTWAENSRENKLTQWSNDPLIDSVSEAVYVKEGNHIFTITPYPVRKHQNYRITHGFGYTVYHSFHREINCEQTVFVPQSKPMKITKLRLKNESSCLKKLSLFYYVKPVMGVFENEQALIKRENNVIYAQNRMNEEFKDRQLFVTSTEMITGVEKEFLSFMGNPKSEIPSGVINGLAQSEPSEYALHPCIAIEISVSIKPHETRELAFVLGQGSNIAETSSCLKQLQGIYEVNEMLKKTKDFWNKKLSVIQIHTPDESMNRMLNGWMLYQSLSCRIWGRSGFYQAGGAYGFRDQLQDCMSMLFADPKIALLQILKHSTHQFLEGDVQHWWHPKLHQDAGDKGVRTRFSDDLLWLPYVTWEYIQKTGDKEILDIKTSFLEEAVLAENEEERYGLPRISKEKASLFEHMKRAVDRSMKRGRNGLPLIGTGDWNDGFSAVGKEGEGESVWLGWFLCDVLEKTAEMCEMKGEAECAERYRTHARHIAKAANQNAWDGEWYIRAFFDNGMPLGSKENDEAKIDAIAQAWAIISGKGEKEKAQQALRSVKQYLVDEKHGLIKLLTPAFDKSKNNPGYIKSYIPGVRENGGQYTHAAVWVCMACAIQKQKDDAYRLYSMLNPVRHSDSQEQAELYKVEPYVISADVYSNENQTGRGGWSWYTGAAGWYYRVGMEYILGFRKNGDYLYFEPCIPSEWKAYQINYNYFDTLYQINVSCPNGGGISVKEIYENGKHLIEKKVPLCNDKQLHKISVVLE